MDAVCNDEDDDEDDDDDDDAFKAAVVAAVVVVAVIVAAAVSRRNSIIKYDRSEAFILFNTSQASLSHSSSEGCINDDDNGEDDVDFVAGRPKAHRMRRKYPLIFHSHGSISS